MLRHVLGGVGGGDDNVRVNLRRTRMLRHVLGGVGGGDDNVRVNLRRTRMLRHVLGGVGGGDDNVRVNLRRTRDTPPCWHHIYKISHILLHLFFLHEQSVVILDSEVDVVMCFCFSEIVACICVIFYPQVFSQNLWHPYPMKSVKHGRKVAVKKTIGKRGSKAEPLCKAPKKMFWRKQVACCRSAWKAERRKKHPARFQHKNPCKLQANMLKPLDFPRENSMIFKLKINSFAMAKTTFFQKRSKRRRGFPPDG